MDSPRVTIQPGHAPPPPPPLEQERSRPRPAPVEVKARFSRIQVPASVKGSQHARGGPQSLSVSYSSLMVLKTSDFLAFVSRFPELASAMETCRAEQLGRYNDRRKTRRMTVARRSPKDLLKSWGNASKASMRMGKSRQDFRRAPTSDSTDDGAATKDGLHEASLHSESALVRYDATRSTGM